MVAPLVAVVDLLSMVGDGWGVLYSGCAVIVGGNSTLPSLISMAPVMLRDGGVGV